MQGPGSFSSGPYSVNEQFNRYLKRQDFCIDTIPDSIVSSDSSVKAKQSHAEKNELGVEAEI